MCHWWTFVICCDETASPFIATGLGDAHLVHDGGHGGGAPDEAAQAAGPGEGRGREGEAGGDATLQTLLVQVWFADDGGDTLRMLPRRTIRDWRKVVAEQIHEAAPATGKERSRRASRVDVRVPPPTRSKVHLG